MFSNGVRDIVLWTNNSRKLSCGLSTYVSISSPLSFRHKRLVFSVFFVRISTKLIKRSDNASVLAGHCTIQCEKILSDTIGIKLLMRDYSEVQSGKSVCDRISGSAKLRMRAFINAGNDVVTAHDIKKSTLTDSMSFKRSFIIL